MGEFSFAAHLKHQKTSLFLKKMSMKPFHSVQKPLTGFTLKNIITFEVSHALCMYMYYTKTLQMYSTLGKIKNYLCLGCNLTVVKPRMFLRFSGKKYNFMHFERRNAFQNAQIVFFPEKKIIKKNFRPVTRNTLFDGLVLKYFGY